HENEIPDQVEPRNRLRSLARYRRAQHRIQKGLHDLLGMAPQDCSLNHIMAPKRCYGATMKRHGLSSNAADLSVLDAVQALRSDRLSAVDLLVAQLERIRERNGGEPSFDGDERAMNAWVRLYPQRAREQAEAADQRLQDDAAGAPLLCGVPWGAKDLFSVAELPVDRKSTRLNSSHVSISYAVFCLKKKRETVHRLN